MTVQCEAHIVLRRLQVEACDALDRSRFGVLICHRRFGKTVLAVARLVRNAANANTSQHRGAYIAPLYRQAKAVAWDYLKVFARPAGATFNESELRADFPSGARITLHGADNPDALRGLNLCDVVFDEVADMPYRVWTEIVMPMLIANHGRAIFIGTPRGKNALYEVWERAKIETDWAAIMYRASDTGVIAPDELARARASMSPEEYEQEFECSFTAAIRGAYYAKLLDDAESEGRVTDVPYDPVVPVWTAWDLGVSDSTSIWFVQPNVAGKLAVIDYYEANGEGLPHYATLLTSKGYHYAGHIGPHDLAVRELGTGKSRIETAASLGLRFQVAKNLPVQDGINAVRSILPRCWFDRAKCQVGLDALRHYRREFNDRMELFRDKPLHDWTSHGADAFRYFAVGYRPAHEGPRQTRAVNDYVPMSYGGASRHKGHVYASV